MTRRRIIIPVIVAILTACVIVYLCAPKEPHYQGRTLSEWMDEPPERVEIAGLWGYPESTATSNAVYQMGTNAIPCLLKWASARDSKTKAAICKWIDSHQFLHLHIRSARERQLAAQTGFHLLAEKAESVRPVFIQWTHDKDPVTRVAGLNFLIATKAYEDKQMFLPILLRFHNDTNSTIASGVTLYLHYFYPQDAEAAGVYRMNPELKNSPTFQYVTNQPAPSK